MKIVFLSRSQQTTLFWGLPFLALSEVSWRQVLSRERAILLILSMEIYYRLFVQILAISKLFDRQAGSYFFPEFVMMKAIAPGCALLITFASF